MTKTLSLLFALTFCLGLPFDARAQEADATIPQTPDISGNKAAAEQAVKVDNPEPEEIIEEDDEDYYREYFPAAPTPIEKTQKPASTTAGSHKLSAWTMYEQADEIVKGVMISLLAASILAWTIWVYKLLSIMVARAKVGRDHRKLASAYNLSDGLSDLGRSRSPLAVMAQSAQGELEQSQDGKLSATGIKERVGSHMKRIELAAGKSISSGTPILATIGSIAPFVGLFGTVWGIMNSFIAISETQTTNLAIVAPGIAEALLATAIGLVAAIPAVIFYNHLVGVISKYKSRVGDGAALVERMISRDLDRAAFERKV